MNRSFIMRLKILILCIALQSFQAIKAQDTFSILAFDSITGEVGAAGASCVDLFQFPGYFNDFITELFPGEGAIATQAAYLPINQSNARNRFVAGDSPVQIINWVVANDAQSAANAQVRQYGVVRMNTGYPRSAAFTGTNCMNYKGHITGPNYSIQGNILLGKMVLDSMEAWFNREKGDLACKLMSAMQGAKMIGADSRCAPNNSSSLFAFLKVTIPTDTFGQPSFLISLKTHTNDGIEPIDSLQILFDAARVCEVNLVGLKGNVSDQENIVIYPNPADNTLNIKTSPGKMQSRCIIRDAFGKKVMEMAFRNQISLNTAYWSRGVYFVEIETGKNSINRKIILN